MCAGKRDECVGPFGRGAAADLPGTIVLRLSRPRADFVVHLTTGIRAAEAPHKPLAGRCVVEERLHRGVGWGGISVCKRVCLGVRVSDKVNERVDQYTSI